MKVINPKRKTNDYFADAEPGDIIQKSYYGSPFYLVIDLAYCNSCEDFCGNVINLSTFSIEYIGPTTEIHFFRNSTITIEE